MRSTMYYKAVPRNPDLQTIYFEADSDADAKRGEKILGVTVSAVPKDEYDVAKAERAAALQEALRIARRGSLF